MSVTPTAGVPTFRSLSELKLSDLENIRLVLRGGSVIDWARLALGTEEEARELLGVLDVDLDDPSERARAEAVKDSAIAYLRRNFDFPIPRPVAELDLGGLLVLASGRGHRQLCACTILKVMHIIHHLEARELLYMLPVSDQDVFHLVEQKVYRVIGSMLAAGLPILEFIGGRKNRDSLYSKLLSKKETHAAQIYDKLRFRIVTRTPEDIFPVLGYLTRHLFPFNYVVPGQTTNTMFDLRRYCDADPHLRELGAALQRVGDDDDDAALVDNRFTAPSYRVVHFVVDMPVRLPRSTLDHGPAASAALGHVVFAQAEFQVIDRETEQANELGDASHDAYKIRQKAAVIRRLKLGAQRTETRDETSPSITLPPARNAGPAPGPDDSGARAPTPPEEPLPTPAATGAQRPSRPARAPSSAPPDKAITPPPSPKAKTKTKRAPAPRPAPAPSVTSRTARAAKAVATQPTKKPITKAERTRPKTRRGR